MTKPRKLALTQYYYLMCELNSNFAHFFAHAPFQAQNPIQDQTLCLMVLAL